jgi:hypothetical protein
VAEAAAVVVEDSVAAVEDSAALVVEAPVVVAQADPGKMNYNMILNIKEPPIGGSFNAYLLI